MFKFIDEAWLQTFCGWMAGGLAGAGNINPAPKHMGKILLALVLGLILMALSAVSLAQQPVQLGAHAKPRAITATATLASVGTCEMDVAADYTALIAARGRATLMLTDKRISVDQAKQVQQLGDGARAHLQAACPDKSARFKPPERDAARAKLRAIYAVLEGKKL